MQPVYHWNQTCCLCGWISNALKKFWLVNETKINGNITGQWSIWTKIKSNERNIQDILYNKLTILDWVLFLSAAIKAMIFLPIHPLAVINVWPLCTFQPRNTNFLSAKGLFATNYHSNSLIWLFALGSLVRQCAIVSALGEFNLFVLLIACLPLGCRVFSLSLSDLQYLRVHCRNKPRKLLCWAN